MTDTVELYITVLEGVFRDALHAEKARVGGMDSDDEVMILVPRGVAARDGVTGAEKQYVPPDVFCSTADKRGIWTLTTDGGTYVTDGTVICADGGTAALRKMHNTYTVTRVAVRDYGRVSMQHIEIRGA